MFIRSLIVFSSALELSKTNKYQQFGLSIPSVATAFTFVTNQMDFPSLRDVLYLLNTQFYLLRK